MKNGRERKFTSLKAYFGLARRGAFFYEFQANSRSETETEDALLFIILSSIFWYINRPDPLTEN